MDRFIKNENGQLIDTQMNPKVLAAQENFAKLPGTRIGKRENNASHNAENTMQNAMMGITDTLIINL